MRERARRSIRAAARYMAWRGLETRIEGLEHLPREGGVVIAARHVHHLYDGCLFLAIMPRPVHMLVALDWVEDRRMRGLMERACSMAGWPVVLRSERLHGTGPCVYQENESGTYLRRAVVDSIAVLRAGRVLVVFPEAYPNIDPHPTPKPNLDSFLPFRPGFAGLADMARREGSAPVPIVPAGLCYEHGSRWRVTLRFGAPLFVENRTDRSRVARAVERQVRRLSATSSARQSAGCYQRNVG
jgi:1-acyl-sn-glycerol-3-phosphate acyltransferase